MIPERQIQDQQFDAEREPPSLQQLVLDHRGLDKITSSAWRNFDARMAAWKMVADGGLHRRKGRDI
jgi:hypothetical protein